MIDMTIKIPEFNQKAIDIHSHFNHGSRFDCPEDEIHVRSFDFLESAYGSDNNEEVQNMIDQAIDKINDARY